jgi:MFS family permease
VLLAQSATLNVCYGATSTIFTVYAVRDLGLSAVRLGVVTAGLAVGALAGATQAGRIRRRVGLGRGLAVSIAGVSLSPLLLLIPGNAGPAAIAVLFAGWLGHGAGIAVWNVNTITLRQAVTPMRVLARMNATYRMLLFGALPLGALAGGLLGAAVGLRTALIVAVIALTSPLCWVLFSPIFRLTSMPDGPQPDRGAGEPAVVTVPTPATQDGQGA